MPRGKETGTKLFVWTGNETKGIKFKSSFYEALSTYKQWPSEATLPRELEIRARSILNIYLAKQKAIVSGNDKFKTVTERQKELAELHWEITAVLLNGKLTDEEFVYEVDRIQGLAQPLQYTSAKAVLQEGFEMLPAGSFVHLRILECQSTAVDLRQYLRILRSNIGRVSKHLQASSNTEHFLDMISYCLRIWEIITHGLSVTGRYAYNNSALEKLGVLPSQQLPNRLRGDETMTTFFYEWLCSLFLQLKDESLVRLCPTSYQVSEITTKIMKKRRLR